MPTGRVGEAIDPHMHPCPRCGGNDDIWEQRQGTTLAGFSILAETIYHNPCGYKRTELRVDDKVVGTLGGEI